MVLSGRQQLENDYAGSAGKPIQLVSIRAFSKDGTKLTSGVIVMYRAFVGGRWLPWVSNADPQWMQNVKNKFSLDGTLDTTGYYAGLMDKTFPVWKFMFFEDSSSNPGSGDLLRLRNSFGNQLYVRQFIKLEYI